MLHKTRAIVFKVTKYSESSVIIKAYTELFGLQSYIINGVRSAKGKSKAALYQHGNLLEMVVYHKQEAGLLRISECGFAHVYENLPFNIVKSSLLIFYLEILNKIVKEQETNDPLFDFLFEIFIELDQTEKPLGDVNADRKADIIWRNSNSGAVAIWLMNGLTALSIGVPGSAILAFEVAGVGDVDGNGTADLIWRNTGSGELAFWLMNGLTIGNMGSLVGKALEWEIAQVSDRDGSGKVDITWFNTNSGKVEIWLMNGVTVGLTGSPGTTSPSWEIQ